LWMDFHPCLYIYRAFLQLLVLEVPFKCKVTPQEWGVPKITAPQARVGCGSFRDSSSLLGSCLRKSTLYKSDKWEPMSNPHEIAKCLMRSWIVWQFTEMPAPMYKNSPPQSEIMHCNTHSCECSKNQANALWILSAKASGQNEGLWFPRQRPPCLSLLLPVVWYGPLSVQPKRLLHRHPTWYPPWTPPGICCGQSLDSLFYWRTKKAHCCSAQLFVYWRDFAKKWNSKIQKLSDFNPPDSEIDFFRQIFILSFLV
jgi:hypothetical protein